MLDVAGYRAELDALRLQLVSLWAQRPFPEKEIAATNQRLVVVLRQLGVKVDYCEHANSYRDWAQYKREWREKRKQMNHGTTERQDIQTDRSRP